MRTGRSDMGSREMTKNIVFFVLLFTYPLLSFVWRRDYPVFSLEVMWLLGILFVTALCVGLLCSRISPAISNLVTALALFLVFVLQLNPSFSGLVVGLIAIGGVLFVFKQRLRRVGVYILAAILLGAWLDSRLESNTDWSVDDPERVDKRLSPVVHILLDGFIGVAGLPDYPASGLIRRKMLTFFEVNDFELYTHAYSRFARTGESVYSAMNFRHTFDLSFGLQKLSDEQHVLQENGVFSMMESMGYRLNIYQTGHINMCRSNPANLDRCWQYDQPNIRSVLGAGDARMRFYALLKTLLSQSRVAKRMIENTEWNAVIEVANYNPTLFDVLSEDLGERPWGNYFYAHALIPHGPYIYQPGCTVSYDHAPLLTSARTLEEPPLQGDVYEVRNGLYFGQIDCALDTLQSLFDDMKARGVYDRAVIVLHGDHGSRIGRYQYLSEHMQDLSVADYRAGFSTLFAVKYPGSRFALRDTPLPLARLLEIYMEEMPNYVREATEHPVISPQAEADPVKTDMNIYLLGEVPPTRVAIDLFGD